MNIAPPAPSLAEGVVLCRVVLWSSGDPSGRDFLSLLVEMATRILSLLREQKSHFGDIVTAENWHWLLQFRYSAVALLPLLVVSGKGARPWF